MMNRQVKRTIRACHGWLAFHLMVAVSLVLLASGAEATPRRPAVIGSFSPEYSTARLGDRVDVVLHLQALAAAPDVEVQFTLPPQVRAVRGSSPWFGALAADTTLDLPLTIELVQGGEYSIVATVRSGKEWAKATLNVLATAQGVQLGTGSLNALKRRAGQSPVEQKEFIEAPAKPGPAVPPKPLTSGEQKLNQLFRERFRKQQEGKAAASAQTLPFEAPSATTVSGHMNWLDTAGGVHPIRFVHVQVLDGGTDTVLVDTMTDASGFYSAGVDAATVKARVISEDFLGGTFVKVHAPVLSSSFGGRYAYISVATPVTGASTVVNITTDQPIRGTVFGGASTDAIQARAFSVFDALMQYQVQAFGLRGNFLPAANIIFPCEDEVLRRCGTVSAYQGPLNVFLILREDAFDWDVLGHEFIHFLTAKGAARTIDNSSGGFHTGGSAIGQPTTQSGSDSRNRDAGLRLAWSEGLATFFAVRLKGSPASTAYGMTWPNLPCSVSIPCDSHYQDSENQQLNLDLPNLSPIPGYGSENSVNKMFWYFTDPQPAGGPGQSGKFGLTANQIWDLINRDLACNPCDRPDRFWSGVVQLLNGGPLLAQVAQTLVLAKIAPELTAPADGSLASGAVSPTFQWNANGDPSANHNPNRFFLMVSKDNFASDFHKFPTNGQPIQGTQYEIPDDDFSDLLQGATSTTVFSWAVLGFREADTDIRIPEGESFWVSNARTFKVRSYHIQLVWNTSGADVDLHFQSPTGASNECYYGNRTPDWGVLGDPEDDPSLDRDCTSSCTEENITIDKVTTPGLYKIQAHYYSDHGHGPTTVTLKIFHGGGTVVFAETHTLNATGDLWEAFSFTVAPSGKVEAASGGGPAMKIMLPANLPDHMRKKE